MHYGSLHQCLVVLVHILLLIVWYDAYHILPHSLLGILGLMGNAYAPRDGYVLLIMVSASASTPRRANHLA